MKKGFHLLLLIFNQKKTFDAEIIRRFSFAISVTKTTIHRKLNRFNFYAILFSL
jgi:hypothetical protein